MIKTVSILIAKLSISILIGMLFHQSLMANRLGLRLKTFYLSYKGSNKYYFHLFLIIWSFYIFLYLIDITFIHYFDSLYSINLDILSASSEAKDEISKVGVEVNTVNVGGVNIPGEALVQSAKNLGNGAIMAAGITAGTKLIANAPTPTGKIAGAAAGLVVGTMGILLKDSASNIGKKNLISLSLTSNEKLNILLGKSGDQVQDFLYALGTLHSVSLNLAIIISIYLMIIYFKPKLIILADSLPLSIRPYYLKWISLYNTTNQSLILIFLILLITSLYLTNFYFDFLIDNFESFIDLYEK